MNLPTPRRSNAPVFWLMFGAGGMLAALIGPALVFLTGIAAPLGWLQPAPLFDYAGASAFAQSWGGKAVLLAVIALFAWHAAHRLLHSLHDLGVDIHGGPLPRLACYGSALVLTVVLAASLVVVGT